MKATFTAPLASAVEAEEAPGEVAPVLPSRPQPAAVSVSATAPTTRNWRTLTANSLVGLCLRGSWCVGPVGSARARRRYGSHGPGAPGHTARPSASPNIHASTHEVEHAGGLPEAQGRG